MARRNPHGAPIRAPIRAVGEQLGPLFHFPPAITDGPFIKDPVYGLVPNNPAWTSGVLDPPKPIHPTARKGGPVIGAGAFRHKGRP